MEQGSRRKSRTMINVNCAVLPANLVESELFGHEKGVNTDAQSKRMGRFEIAGSFRAGKSPPYKPLMKSDGIISWRCSNKRVGGTGVETALLKSSD